MTKFVSLVEQKNADGFKTAVEAALAEKVADVLDGLKPIVAAKFFGEDAQGAEVGGLSDKTCNISNEGEPAPGVGQAPDAKGGLSNVQAGSKGDAGGDHSQEKTGFTADKLKTITPRPGTTLARGVKMPGK